MPYPAGFIDELCDRCNIVDVVSGYVRLKKTGANYVGLCPFHSEKTPSFTVSAEKQLFKCFGCGEGGSVVSFVMKIENLSFPDAVRKLCDYCGMAYPENDDAGFSVKKRVLELNRAAARFYFETLATDAGKDGLSYLRRRGLSDAAIRSFGLGYADQSWDSLIKAMLKKGFTTGELEAARLASKGKNGSYYDFFRERVMFPIIDERGDVIAFSGRVMTSGDEGRKYMNSPDTPAYNKSRALFGINLAKKTKSDFFLLVEGNMDVVSLHAAGIDNAVASCGTALTPQQAQLIKKYVPKVVVCFDQDAAGQKATDKAINVLSAADIEVRVLRLPYVKNEKGELLLDKDGKPVKDDPDSFIRRSGADAFSKLLSKPPSDIEYRLATIKESADLLSDDGRIAYFKEAARYLATIPSDVEREVYVRSTAQEMGLSETSLLNDVKRIRAAMLRERKKKEFRAAADPIRNIQPEERSIRYSDPISAASEERLLAVCFSDTDLLRYAGEKITPEKFSSELLGSVFGKALAAVREGRGLSPAALVTDLSDAEARHITSVLTKAVRSEDPVREINDCVSKINLEYIKRSGSSDDKLEALLAEKRNRGNG